MWQILPGDNKVKDYFTIVLCFLCPAPFAKENFRGISSFQGVLDTYTSSCLA